MTFAADEYEIVHGFLPESVRSSIETFVMTDWEGDRYYVNRGDVAPIIALHEAMRSTVESITGLSLVPEHCGVRVYEPGAFVGRHVDPEPIIAISVSVNVAGNYPDGYAGWPMSIEVNGVAHPVVTNPNDALVFWGRNPHWRDVWEIEDGSYQIQMLLFYTAVERVPELEEIRKNFTPEKTAAQEARRALTHPEDEQAEPPTA